jgi:hypothetical protein
MAASNCPGCGAPIEFKHQGALVTVCQFCSSVVGRGDVSLTDLGKVSPIIDSASPLELGITGRWQEKRFELVGRAQLKHAAGGFWDEWYLSFNDGRWGWLAEAQGRFYLTFPREKAKPPRSMPVVGDRLVLGDDSPSFVVAEAGEATLDAASGEIPYELEPNARYSYADLSGPSKAFATIDYSGDEPTVYAGREVSLDDIGIKGRSVVKAATVSAVHVKCPHCAGPLELRTQSSERAVCPNCDSLLDINQGEFKFLKTIRHSAEAPHIPLGSKGELFGTKFTVVGYVVRSVNYEGVRYPWREYLLYEPRVGFRWLAESDGHFSFGEPVNLADVIQNDERRAEYQGQNYRIFQKGVALIDDVRGEFYWRVSVGDRANTQDFIRPPEMLSSEDSVSNGTAEIQWTKLTYVPVKDIAAAFNLKDLAKPEGVAPNQRFPHKDVFSSFFKLLGIAFVALVGLSFAQANKTVFEQRYELAPMAAGEVAQAIFSVPFTVDRTRNMEIALAAPVNNSWAFIEGDLINEKTDEVREFTMPLEYYHGVDGGESWSEGGQSNDITLGRVPAGDYVLRLEVQREKTAEPLTLSVVVKSGVTQVGHFFLVLLMLGILPMIVAIRNLAFDRKRWSVSDYTPYTE